MTMDKSLKIHRASVRNRSVLKRSERIVRLKESDLWHEGDSPFGLPKVRVYKLSVKKKKKSKKEEAAQTAAGEGAATGAEGGGATQPKK